MMGLLSKLLVPRYFKMNAGFFLFLVLILFGILPAEDTMHLHKGLMIAAVSSTMGLGTAAAVATLYGVKCLSFFLRETMLPENSFLHIVRGLHPQRQVLLFSVCFTFLYSPLLSYAAAAIFIGLISGFVAGSMVLLAIVMSIALIGGIIVYLRLNNFINNDVFGLSLPGAIRKRSFYTYLLHHLFYDNKGALISIKICSMLALQLLVTLNAGKPSRENVCFLMLLCIAAHALLPVYLVHFAETQMRFTRTLPLALFKRLLQFVISYSVILLPEIIFLLWNEVYVITLGTIASLFFLAVAILTFYSVLQYLHNMTLQRYTGVVFCLFFACLFLLTVLNLLFLAFVIALLSASLFYRAFYKYEVVDMSR